MTQYTARIEMLTGLLRVYLGNGDDPDPYVLAITILWHAPHTAELKGLRQDVCQCGQPAPNPIRYRKPICDALRTHGVREMTWTRKECGDERVIRMDTTTYRLIK